MDRSSSNLLRAFFAIPAARIAIDVRKAGVDPAAIHTELRKIRRRFRESGYSVDLNAHWAHILLVQATALFRNPGIPREFALFHAICAARRIAGECESVAFQKGRLAELILEMDALRELAGLAGDEEWTEATIPPAYKLLTDEFSRRMDAVGSAMLEDILRRYFLGPIADLRETDEQECEIQFEIGQRVAFSRTRNPGASENDSDDSIEATDANRFSPEIWVRIHTRVATILSRKPFGGPGH